MATLKITADLSNRIEKAASQIEFAGKAASGLICGKYDIDEGRLQEARSRMKNADKSFQDGNLTVTESELAWAYHFAATCGASSRVA